MKIRRFSSLVQIIAVAVGAGAHVGAMGAGFALYEQSASGLGNAYAGAAASAEDASTVWWNPAGMTLLPAGKQIVVAGHAILPSTRFSNTGSAAGLFQSAGNEGGNAGDLAALPNIYFAMDLSPTTKFGIGVNVPFGLSTKYDPNWMGRFQGIDTTLQTININPSIAWKTSDTLSLGAGLSYQQAELNLLTAVNYTALEAAIGVAPVPGTQGQNRVKVEDNGSWGWNAGLNWLLNPGTRLGVAYRSSIKHDASGTTSFSGVPAAVTGNPVGAVRTAGGNVTLTAKLPDSFSVSLTHQYASKWTVLADMTWTGWDKLQTLYIVRDTGATLSTLPLLFRNTTRYSVGADYRLNDDLTVKAGIAFDESPVKAADTRTVRVPDNNRTWFSFGAKYRVSRAGALDFGYSYVKVKNAPINQIQNATGNGNVVGNYSANVSILSLQYTHNF